MLVVELSSIEPTKSSYALAENSFSYASCRTTWKRSRATRTAVYEDQAPTCGLRVATFATSMEHVQGLRAEMMLRSQVVLARETATKEVA